MAEDEELDEATKRILDRTKNIRFTGDDAKRNRSGKRAQKEKISKPSLSRNTSKPSLNWDEKENFWDEIKDLEAEKAIEKIEKELANVNDKKHEIDLWIKLGEKLYYIRKEGEAAEKFKAALIRDPDNITAIKSLGWCYQKLNKFSDARDCTKKILESDEKNVDALIDYAWCSQELKDWNQAREYYLKVLGIDEKNVDANDNLGYVYFKQEKYDQALNCFETSRKLERDDDDNYAEEFLARCYFRLGRDDDCECMLDLVIKKNVTDWYVYYMKGEILVNKKLFVEAIEYYKKSINLKEQRLNVFGLGRCYAKDEKWDFAILFYEKSLEISREDAAVTLGNLAACYKRKDDPDLEKSLELCDKALEEESNYQNAIYTKVHTFRKLNRPRDAIVFVDEWEKVNGVKIDDLDILIELMRCYDITVYDDDAFLEKSNRLTKYDDKYTAQYWKARALEQNGKIDEAEKWLDGVIEKWPDKWSLYVDKGSLIGRIPNRVLEQLENYQKGLQLLEKMEWDKKARDLQESKEEMLSSLHLKIGRVIKEMANLVERQNGLPDEGIRKEGIDKKFEKEGIDKKGLLDKALSHIDLAIKYNADSWEAWFENGNCFWGLKRYNDAFENYIQAQRLNPNDVGIWCCLGDTARQINNSISEAKYYFQKAVSVSNKEIKEEDEMIWNDTKKEYDWVDAQNGLIRCLYNEKKYDDVILEADKIFSISKDRDDWGPLRYTALSFGELKKYSEAIDMWERGIKDFPDDNWFVGNCHYCASLDANSLGLEKDADEYAKKLIDLDVEESADGYQLLGAYLTDNEQYKDAITILEEHLADFSEFAKKQALGDLITCCDKLGNKEKKEEYEKRLKELKEKD